MTPLSRPRCLGPARRRGGTVALDDFKHIRDRVAAFKATPETERLADFQYALRENREKCMDDPQKRRTADWMPIRLESRAPARLASAKSRLVSTSRRAFGPAAVSASQSR